MPPTIVFVPGFWEGGAPFAKVISILQSQGYPTDIALLPSTGTTSPGNPSMSDDIAAVHSKIAEIVNKDQDVLLVTHSAGGFLGSNAIQDLETKTRQDKGLSGGVGMIVFLAGGILPEGFEHQALPFFKIDVCFPLRSLYTCLHWIYFTAPDHHHLYFLRYLENSQRQQT